jgi:hypothetical protein
MSKPNKKPAASAVLARDLRERALRAEQEGDPLALLEDAADEIDRLAAEVERLRITEEEWQAMGWAIRREMDAEWHSGQEFEMAVTLCGLRDRHAKGGAA